MSDALNRPEDFEAVPVLELELSDQEPVLEPNRSGQLLMLVRLHGVPLGTVAILERSAASATDPVTLALTRLRHPLLAHLEADHLPVDDLRQAVHRPASCTLAVAPSSLSASVVVCTLGEDPRLVTTVASVLAQTHTDFELIVVDNQPGSGRVRHLLAGVVDRRLRLVEQPRRGLSAARNAGVAAATGEVVAFTDDDAVADPDWLTALLAPFEADPSVACTTGLVLPAELSTRAQLLFEEFGAFDKGFEPTVWSMVAAPPAAAALGRRGDGGVLFPYSAGVYGSGNNMAFRTSWLRGERLFDEALGAGSHSRGGEDLDAFLTVMLSGAVLVYEPRAVVRHHARSDLAALRGQMYGYGSGMAAVVVKHALRPRRALEILRRLPAGVGKLLAKDSEKNAGRSEDYPADLIRAELRGYAAGPALYLRGRIQKQRPR